MGNKIFIYGSIRSTNKQLHAALASVNNIDKSKLNLKLKDFGYEVDYKDNNTYIYCYGNELEDDSSRIVFESESNKTLDEIHLFINDIIQQLKSKNITFYGFEYYEQDIEGNIVSEEFEINSWE